MINKNRLIRLTRDLIRINSENPPGNEKEISGFIKKYLGRIGVKCSLIEFAKGRTNVLALIKSKEPKAKTILISPHLDTVPAGRGWKVAPFEGRVINGKIYGRGATDCKGNLAVAIETINSIIEDKAEIKNNILFAATADEETGSGFGLIPLLKKNFLKCDYALILDSDKFDIVIAQKGLIHFKVSVFGRKAHGAYPWKGINAINIASDIIQDLKKYKFKYKKHPLLHPPTINIGTIHGGDKVNMVSDWCEFEVDIRYLPGMSSKEILPDIRRVIAKRAKKFNVKIDGIQDPYEISKSHPLVERLAAVSKKYAKSCRGGTVCRPYKGSEGATVITFFKDKNIPAVAWGFGAQECCHVNDEYASIESLYKGAKALEKFLAK